MKVEDIENWPADACFSLWRTKFKLITGENPTVENIREWFKTGHNRTTNVVLFANPRTMRALDTQVPTTDSTYREYLLMSGIVDHIVEDRDSLTDDDDVYLFIFN